MTHIKVEHIEQFEKTGICMCETCVTDRIVSPAIEARARYISLKEIEDKERLDREAVENRKKIEITKDNKYAKC
jgi:hypothetical protein